MQADNNLKENLLAGYPNHKQQDEDIKQQKDKSYLGYIYQLFFIISLCLQHLFSKLMFNRHVNLSALQILVIRACFTAIIFIVVMNRKIKHVMITSIPRQSYFNLTVRCIQGLIAFTLVYYALRYLPLVFVALVMNLSPIFIAILSYLVLKEQLMRIDIIILGVSFIGVIILVSGSINSENVSQSKIEDTSNIFAWIALFLIPFSAAINAVNQRQMRDLNEYTVGSYMTLVSLLGYTPIVLLFENGFGIIYDFEMYDWALAILLGITGFYFNVFRFKALQYQEPGKLGGISYFQSIIQLILDVVFLGQKFTSQQLIGIMVVICANGVKLGLWIKKLLK
ncbi:membrane protein [Stylonychia lemnae]|uniref:Membrane protein n=1 Tax=Stylonychia lemnae TaxID=5949 RepID=A0A078AKD8_STYLE|nr:membrane protein [Stylonychia lemnae]|eukprot:CDW82674.1 membrane protein [Stylonychia lemnae]